MTLTDKVRSVQNSARKPVINGGEVKTITFVDGYSSTSIINRIKQQ